MFKTYLKQRATLLKFQGYNGNGEPQYYQTVFYAPGQPVPVECSLYMPVRWENNRRLVKNRFGAEVVSEGTIYSVVEPTFEDKFRDEAGREWPIIAIEKDVDLNGKVLGYEVAV